MDLSESLVEIENERSALLSYANGVTGESDDRLGEAVRRLADGFGTGGSEDVLLFETEMAVKTSNTSAEDILNIDVSDKVDFSKSYMFRIEVLDLKGKRNGYYYGTVANVLIYLGTIQGFSRIITVDKNGSEKNNIGPNGNNTYGIFLTNANYNQSTNILTFDLRKRYNVTYSLDIDGNFSIKIYAREIPAI